MKYKVERKGVLKLICLLVMSTVLLVGCDGFLSGSNALSGDENSEIQPSSSLAIEGQPSAIEGKVPVRLYFADADNHVIKKEIRYIDREEASKSVNNLCGVIVNEMLMGPDVALGISTPYFGSVIMNGDVAIDSTAATATIDLSEDFLACGSGDEKTEKLVIYSIVNSLTEIKEIQRVKINIDGKKNECMKSGLSLESAFERDESMLELTAATADPNATDDGSAGSESATPLTKKQKKKLQQSIANGSASDEQVANASNTITDGLYDNE